VTNAGAAVMLYEARVHWARLVVRYASLLVDEPGGRRAERATTRGVEAPRVRDGCITLRNSTLDVEGRWHSGTAPIRQTLLSDASGEIEWMCHMPNGRASVRCGRTVYEGRGYAECLRLTMPPWKVPIHTLHWGRHTSDAHSLVWIEWHGPQHRTWAWLDGSAQPDAKVTALGVAGLERRGELRLAGGRDLRDRRVLGAVGALLPAVLRRAAGPMAGMQERKRVAHSAIVRGGLPVDAGWALHEVVTW
jgi:hypothetical protein